MTAKKAKVTANPRQPNRRAIRHVTSKIGTVETAVPKKSSAMNTGDGASGTCHKRGASPTGGPPHTPTPAAVAPAAHAPAKRRQLGRFQAKANATGGMARTELCLSVGR